MASVSRILARNWLPNPSPLEAPFTSPAISTKVMRAGITCLDAAMPASLSSRTSGTATSPTLGSIVQKGKFAACAAAVRVSALNSVDLPTFGSPTIPMLKPMMRLLQCASARMGGINAGPLATRSIRRASRSRKDGPSRRGLIVGETTRPTIRAAVMDQDPGQQDEHGMGQPAGKEDRRDPDEQDQQGQERPPRQQDRKGRQEKGKHIVHTPMWGASRQNAKGKRRGGFPYRAPRDPGTMCRTIAAPSPDAVRPIDFPRHMAQTRPRISIRGGS